MLYYLGEIISNSTDFGPGRLLTQHSILIALALYTGFLLVRYGLPAFYKFLPHDRGREFTKDAELAKGKPTGAGVFWISAFVILSLIFVPLDWLKTSILVLTWLMMLTGYLDDNSISSWGEYKKAVLDLAISVIAALLVAIYLKNQNFTEGFQTILQEDGTSRITAVMHEPDGLIHLWIPFIKNTVAVAPWLFVIIATIILWVSVNTTNCTDGVDGLSGTHVLVALLTTGIIFYFILGHYDIATYLLVPQFKDGAKWAVMIFTLAGVLMGYLWHNAFPSHVLMGDAGSRALGFFIGICVLVSGNPFMLLATSSIMLIDGGLGLLMVFLKRFLHISIFKTIRFPLHDHMKVDHGWSPTQVLIKFLILQLLITVAVVGIMFKLR